MTIRAALLTMVLTACGSLHAQQGMERIIREIEENNMTLRALRHQIDARRLENRTGIFLPDPRADYNYLWGNQHVTGNRVNLALTQSLDFPTAYVHRRQISDSRNDQLEMEYEGHLKTILYQARLVLIELVHLNAREREYIRRVEHARDIAMAVETRLQAGETGLPDYNKAQLNLLNIEKESEVSSIERAVLLSELTVLNGGREVEFTRDEFEELPLPEEFEQWYLEAEKNIPRLQWLAMETEISRWQEKLSASMGLPRMHAGYMSESIGAGAFRGITAGITIPLWENRNRVRQARAQTLAVQEVESDGRNQFYHQLRAQYDRAAALQRVAWEYRSGLESHDNTRLLKRALDLGEINLTEYILELTLYYRSIDRLMESERDMHTAIAALYRYF
jgi:outer membrane protein, heavy metal efflux system